MISVDGFAERLVELRDGARLSLRGLRSSDADALREHMVRGSATTDQILTTPGDVMSAAGLRGELERAFDSGRGLMVAACEPSDRWTIVGHAGIVARDKAKVGHVATLGMMIDEPWRGRGLGRVLMDAMLGWARAHPRVLRVELDVLETNDVGLALYRRCGFEEEGRKRRAFLQPDGSFVDLILMGLWIGDDVSSGR